MTNGQHNQSHTRATTPEPRRAVRRCVAPSLRGFVASSAAFTLVELIVVMVIIVVLAGILLMVGAHLMSHNLAQTTENTMRLVRGAIDQFSTEDPLQNIYNNARLREPPPSDAWVGQTFGSYPPYQLAGTADSDSAIENVHEAVEVWHPILANAGPAASLRARLRADLSGTNAVPPDVGDSYVYDKAATLKDAKNDDIRSLYAYLAAYTPGVLTQIPDAARKPLTNDPKNPEMINPTGNGVVINGSPAGPGAVDVLGIYDAWGVPLDYFLEVKLAYGVSPNDVNQTPRWMVVERIPILRSLGITPEEVAAEAAGTDPLDPQRWILSEPFPQPWSPAVVADTGVISGTNPRQGGWVQAVAEGQVRDRYVPEQP